MSDIFPSGEQLITGPSGTLELVVALPTDYRSGHPVAAVCHPHPLHGGSMANKVVHMLSKTLVELGLPCVRFNFRGVGRSEGQFDDGNGETDDLLAVITWVHQQFPDAPLCLSGFSFGAYVALRASQRTTVARLLLVAPPVDMYEFGGLTLPAAISLVIQGGQDEIVNADAVQSWLKKNGAISQLIWLDNADHFFHGRLNQLRTALKDAWQPISF
jgi:alpha/beta superfamily hydrolase